MKKDFIDVLEFGHNPRRWRTNINLHKSFFFTINTIRAKSKVFCYVEIQIIDPLSGPVYKRKTAPGCKNIYLYVSVAIAGKCCIIDHMIISFMHCIGQKLANRKCFQWLQRTGF